MHEEKAQKFLANALLALMEQKPYGKINISEICSNAFLSRTSFYKYFSSKDELLRYQLKSQFCTAAKRSAAYTPEIRLAQCLSDLAGYTQIITEQKLLTLLLPDIGDVMSTELHCGNTDLFHTCYEYISILFAVRAAAGASPETAARCRQTAEEELPNIVIGQAVRGHTSRSRSIAALTDALTALLERGVPLANIHVKELTAAAGFNRSSFYRLFPGIQELSIYSLRKLITDELIIYPMDEEAVLLHYRPYKGLFSAAWQELGLEGFAALYTSVINEFTSLPDDDIPAEQLYIARLRNVCLAAKRTALLYTSL